MKYSTYIIFSKAIGKFYTGSTSMIIEERIKRHNYNHSGFTGKAQDWIIVFHIQFDSIQKARQLEKKIKKRGAKRFINDN